MRRANFNARVAHPALVFLPRDVAAQMTAAAPRPLRQTPARPRRAPTPPVATPKREQQPVAVVLGCGSAIRELKALVRGRADMAIKILNQPTGGPVGKPARKARQ